MRKKLTLTIDAEVYDMLQGLPRKVSVSELASWLFKTYLEELKRGREMTKEELKEFIESTPEGKDFRERGREQYGPAVDKIEDTLQRFKKKVGRPKKVK
jgi:predicted CopG family antitoxin